jgi:hypothetical protein
MLSGGAMNPLFHLRRLAQQYRELAVKAQLQGEMEDASEHFRTAALFQAEVDNREAHTLTPKDPFEGFREPQS